LWNFWNAWFEDYVGRSHGPWWKTGDYGGYAMEVEILGESMVEEVSNVCE